MRTKAIPFDYHTDFYAWINHNVELLRSGRLAELDRENVAEELEDMGKSYRRELTNCLAILLAHLLKWQLQPERRGNSWKATIDVQRDELQDLLQESPSLKHQLAEHFKRAYEKSLLIAIRETNLSKEVFPPLCPFTLNQVLDTAFLPE